jgi:integrase
MTAALKLHRQPAPLATTWPEFRKLYLTDVLPGMAESTQAKLASLFKAFEQGAHPGRLCDLCGQHVSAFIAARRRKGIRDTTIRGDLGHLQSAFAWMKRHGLISEIPQIDKPKRAKAQKAMKGRPVTHAEFDSILAQTSDPAWMWLLRGLWASGLRLGEALALTWEPGLSMSLDFTRKRPMLRIPASAEKGNQERLLPISPEFAELLSEVPQSERTGRVFRVPLVSQEGISAFISDLGRAAGVVVHREKGRIKFASAHDFRRSFGERWAMKVEPAVLTQLMRHEKYETTQRYYVGRNADVMAEAIWNAF